MQYRKNKYGNEKVRVFGKEYDSKTEARYAMYLRGRLSAGEIKYLQEQVRYELIPKQVVELIPGKKETWHATTYVADFVFYDLGQMRTRVIDVKSPATAKNPEFRIKRKLMQQVHGITVEVVMEGEKWE